MGFQSIMAFVLTAPPYFEAGFLGIPFAWSSGRFNDRTWHMTAGLSLVVVGFAISCATTDQAARYASTFLYAIDAYSVGSVILGCVSNTLSQTPEKKAVAYSLVDVSANMVSIALTCGLPVQLRYFIGFSAMVGFAVTSIICAWAMRTWVIRLNNGIHERKNQATAFYAF